MDCHKVIHMGLNIFGKLCMINFYFLFLMQTSVEINEYNHKEIKYALREIDAVLKWKIWIITKCTFWRGFGVLSPPNETSLFLFSFLRSP
jgi:hypothetical protein